MLIPRTPTAFVGAYCCLFVLLILAVFLFPVALPIILCCICCCCAAEGICQHEIHDADKVADILYQEQNGRNYGLPRKLWGVWWMSDNGGPELLANLDGFDFDPEKHEIFLHSGKPLTWSHNSDCFGYFGWCGLKAGYFANVMVHLKFNKDYTFADMPMTWLCGVPMFNGQRWTMKEIDSDTWFRVTYCCCSKTPSKKGSYTLKKIIDGDGHHLPSFEEMMQQLRTREPVQGLTIKTMKQIVNVRTGGTQQRAPVQKTMRNTAGGKE